MELAYMYGKDIDRDGIDVFRGINKKPRIADNEFSDMENMCGEDYPCITTRHPRKKLRTIEKPNGMIANGKLAWVDGNSLWYNGEEVSMNGIELADTPKQMVNMGAWIVIFPDKIRFNTITGECTPLENVRTGTASAVVSRIDGQPYVLAATKEESPEDGTYYLDKTLNTLYVYSETYDGWQPVPTVYVKIQADGIGSGFAVNDGVTVSGLGSLDGTHVLRAVGDNFVVITGIIPQSIENASVTLSRTVPELDFVCEQNNRLWGCKYGRQGNEFVNEIYACALGDPTNWNQFDGTSMDSYVASLGSSGAFTGMVSHLGYVMAFKEDVVHKIYGNYPANFQIADTRARGIANGSAKSAAIAQETLLYLSPTDAVAMGTGLPTGISDALIFMELHSGVGGIHKRKYYLGCKDEQGNSHLFVYDIDNNIWYREDGLDVLYATSCDGELYLIACVGGEYGLYCVGDEPAGYLTDNAVDEDLAEWSITSGLVGLKYPEHKYVSQFMIRLEALEDATIYCDVMYDNDEEWRNVYEESVSAKDNVRISVRPRHCDTMRYKLYGTGRVRLYSIVKHTETAEEW